jgi:hypothetical protein
VRLIESVEAFFLNAQVIFTGREIGELTASALVGFTSHSRLRGRLHGDPSRRDSDSVLVEHHDRRRNRGNLSGSSGADGDDQKEGTHAFDLLYLRWMTRCQNCFPEIVANVRVRCDFEQGGIQQGGIPLRLKVEYHGRKARRPEGFSPLCTRH